MAWIAVRPVRRRAALAGDVGGRGPLRRRRRAPPRRDVRDLRAAAERDGRAAHGPRAQRLDPGRADPLAPDAGLRHALAARLRPRRHLDAERRREAARRGGDVAAGDRPRRVPRADVELARDDRADDHGPVPPPRRVARLLARALHDGRRVRRGGDDVLRPSLGRRLDLPREPDRQLVPLPPDGDLRPRGRARRDGRHAHRTCATRSPTATEAGSRSRRCGRRRSSPTSPSPCIPTTRATASAVGTRGRRPRRRAPRARRSPTRASTPSSAPARSRSRPGHDPIDFDIGRDHGLETLTVIGPDGRMIAEGLRGPRPEGGRRARDRVAGRARARSRGASRTATRSARASGATRGSSRSSRRSGGARWTSSPRRRSRRCASGASASTRRASTGSRSSRSSRRPTGASRASSGGGTRSRSGRAPTAT